MANHARGFTTIRLGDETFDVALGLGALAELESEFGVESFEEALNFGDKISGRKLRSFLFALLRGNAIKITPEVERQINLYPPHEFMEMLTDLLVKGGFSSQQSEAAKADPLVVKRAGKRG